MKNALFYLDKYVFRLLHISTFGLIFGNLFYDYIFGKRIEKLGDRRNIYVIIHIVSSIILMASGLINMIILVNENNYIKNIFYTIWKNILIGKFFLTLTITPLLDKMVKDQNLAFNIRVITVCGLLLMSPFLRFFREYLLTPLKKSVSTDEMKELKNN